MEFRKMRRFRQQISDEECCEVLTKEKRGVLAMNGEGGYPYAVTLNYFFDEESGKIYFHSAKEGHKRDALKEDDRVCFTVCEQGKQREDWSYHARSVVVFGRIRTVGDHFEAVSLVRRLAYKYYPTETEEERRAVENDIIRNSPRMDMLELTPEHITGKLVHEK